MLMLPPSSVESILNDRTWELHIRQAALAARIRLLLREDKASEAFRLCFGGAEDDYGIPVNAFTFESLVAELSASGTKKDAEIGIELLEELASRTGLSEAERNGYARVSHLPARSKARMAALFHKHGYVDQVRDIWLTLIDTRQSFLVMDRVAVAAIVHAVMFDARKALDLETDFSHDFEIIGDTTLIQHKPPPSPTQLGDIEAIEAVQNATRYDSSENLSSVIKKMTRAAEALVRLKMMPEAAILMRLALLCTKIPLKSSEAQMLWKNNRKARIGILDGLRKNNISWEQLSTTEHSDYIAEHANPLPMAPNGQGWSRRPSSVNIRGLVKFISSLLASGREDDARALARRLHGTNWMPSIFMAASSVIHSLAPSRDECYLPEIVFLLKTNGFPDSPAMLKAQMHYFIRFLANASTPVVTCEVVAALATQVSRLKPGETAANDDDRAKQAQAQRLLITELLQQTIALLPTEETGDALLSQFVLRAPAEFRQQCASILRDEANARSLPLLARRIEIWKRIDFVDDAEKLEALEEEEKQKRAVAVTRLAELIESKSGTDGSYPERFNTADVDTIKTLVRDATLCLRDLEAPTMDAILDLLLHKPTLQHVEAATEILLDGSRDYPRHCLRVVSAILQSLSRASLVDATDNDLARSLLDRCGLIIMTPDVRALQKSADVHVQWERHALDLVAMHERFALDGLMTWQEAEAAVHTMIMSIFGLRQLYTDLSMSPQEARRHIGRHASPHIATLAMCNSVLALVARAPQIADMHTLVEAMVANKLQPDRRSVALIAVGIDALNPMTLPADVVEKIFSRLNKAMSNPGTPKTNATHDGEMIVGLGAREEVREELSKALQHVKDLGVSWQAKTSSVDSLTPSETVAVERMLALITKAWNKK
nr:hypothetical protein HK105_006224 [Polyrhizophydium stewartii]